MRMPFSSRRGACGQVQRAHRPSRFRGLAAPGPGRTPVFAAAHFRPVILAEGHIHRSLGHRPRNTSEHPLFGRRPYSPLSIGQREYGLRPKEAGRHRGPGALPSLFYTSQN